MGIIERIVQSEQSEELFVKRESKESEESYVKTDICYSPI